MRQDTVYLKRYNSDGRITRDQFYVKNFRELYVVMKYIREVVATGTAHFDVKFVCYSQNFTLIGAI